MNPKEASKEVVIFVHGFNSSKECWTHGGKSSPKWKLWAKQKDLIGDLAMKEPDLSRQFDFDFFEYSTKIVSRNPDEEIPTFARIAEEFGTWLSKKAYDKRKISLVGHSQGGLIVLRYLKLAVETNQAFRLGNIKQAILIACPQKGSTLFYTARKFFGLFIKNPHNDRLHVLDDKIDHMLALVSENILKASEKTSTTWPIPICSFYGIDDDIVTKVSARGELAPGACFPLEGNHFTVIQPRNSDDDRYKDLKKFLYNPVGHKRILLIENYETHLIISPEGRNEEIDFSQRKETVRVQSIGLVNRKVRLSERNVSEDFFHLRYETLDNGFLQYEMGNSHGKCEVVASKNRHYREKGTAFGFFIKPKPGIPITCFLNLKVFNGFNMGNTKAHFHLSPRGQALRLIENMEYTLDLSAYIRQGKTPITPALYLHPENPADCDDICKTRVEKDFREPVMADPKAGIWKWKLQKVEGGVIDIIWDF